MVVREGRPIGTKPATPSSKQQVGPQDGDSDFSGEETMRQQRGTFKAYGGDGQEYRIVAFTTDVRDSSGGIERREEIPRLQTSDRRTVKWLKKGKYKILDRHQDIIVTSTDPGAF